VYQPRWAWHTVINTRSRGLITVMQPSKFMQYRKVYVPAENLETVLTFGDQGCLQDMQGVRSKATET
jgi:hypothetical protein